MFTSIAMISRPERPRRNSMPSRADKPPQLGVATPGRIRLRRGARRVCAPQRRRVAVARSGPEAEGAALVDAGAVGGDAADDVLGGQNG